MLQPSMDSTAAALPINFRKITSTLLHTRKMGVVLGVAQTQKIFQIWQNDFLNLFAAEIGKKCVMLNQMIFLRSGLSRSFSGPGRYWDKTKKEQREQNIFVVRFFRLA